MKSKKNFLKNVDTVENKSKKKPKNTNHKFDPLRKNKKYYLNNVLDPNEIE